MAELLKALLQEVSADESQRPIGDPVPVQFNPTSLRLRLQNQTDGGRSRGRQRRQHNGASSTTLSMDLVFDTADEGSDEAPVSVRTKTAMVEKYLLPKDNTSDAPPRLQFQWDQLIIAGVVESLDVDFDHFAANGAPLRAKVSLSIKEQEPKYTYAAGASGPAARDSSAATPPGGGGAAPGSGTNETPAGGNSSLSDTALDGETAPEFLARHGLDPSAWRGLGVDLSAGLSLSAGVEVGFSAGLSASVGLGVSVGVMASAGVSLEASLGLNASAVFAGTAQAGAAPGGAGSAAATGAADTARTQSQKVNGDQAGLALSAAGGVQSAVERLKIQETQKASGASRSAFGIPATATPSASGPGSGASKPSAPAVAGPSRADPRSAGFGFGVPLRPLYPTALAQTETSLCSSGPGADGQPPFRRQVTTPPWQALPRRDSTRTLAESAESRRRRSPCDYIHHPCGCD